MIRLFCPGDFQAGFTLPLTDRTAHYLFHVMRRQIGDDVLVFNGRNGEWQARLATQTKKGGTLILETQTRKQEAPAPLILCPALIKKEPLDFVLQKATELGVTAIYPLLTDRTVVSHLNLERAQAILIEAAEQSERLTVPTLFQPQPLTKVLADLPKTVTPICLAERSDSVLKPKTDQTPALFIGPEGGWTPAELEQFQRANTQFWHLGNTILRAETAALAALACYQFGFKV